MEIPDRVSVGRAGVDLATVVVPITSLTNFWQPFQSFIVGNYGEVGQPCGAHGGPCSKIQLS